MMKRAQAFRRKGHYYFCSSSMTTQGFWISTAPFVKIDHGEQSGAIANAAAEVLRQSQVSVPHPTDWRAVFAPMLELAAVRSWGAFAKGAESCSIQKEGGYLTITPYKNLGPRGGFEPISREAISLPASSSEEDIASALESAFAICESHDRE